MWASVSDKVSDWSVPENAMYPKDGVKCVFPRGADNVPQKLYIIKFACLSKLFICMRY